jgi:hypothetical protein
VPQWMETIQSARSYNPKTVLGFLATVVGIAVVGCTAAGTALLLNDKVLWLVPIVFAFGALLVVGVLVGVFLILFKDPSKLLLTQLSGTEYLDIQRGLVLGDSASGEQVVHVPQSANGGSNSHGKIIKLEGEVDG